MKHSKVITLAFLIFFSLLAISTIRIYDLDNPIERLEFTQTYGPLPD